MSNFCRCGCRNNTANELCSLCEPSPSAYRTEYQRGYLAGLEAARQAVPGPMPSSPAGYVLVLEAQREAHNACRATTLSNLTALVKEAQK